MFIKIIYFTHHNIFYVFPNIPNIEKLDIIKFHFEYNAMIRWK